MDKDPNRENIIAKVHEGCDLIVAGVATSMSAGVELGRKLDAVRVALGGVHTAITEAFDAAERMTAATDAGTQVAMSGIIRVLLATEAQPGGNSDLVALASGIRKAIEQRTDDLWQARHSCADDDGSLHDRLSSVSAEVADLIDMLDLTSAETGAPTGDQDTSGAKLSTSAASFVNESFSRVRF